MKTSFKNCLLFFALILFLTNCKKDEPVPMGALIAYTNIDSDEYERIDIIVDEKVVGSLTAPNSVKPVCGSANSESVLRVPLQAGKYQVYAKQYRDGKNVGEWPIETETIDTDKCTWIHLVE